MAAVRLIFDETERKMRKLGSVQRLDLRALRLAVSGPLRYCVQNNKLYLPEDESFMDKGHRLCWGRIRFEEIEERPWLGEFDKKLPEDPLAYHQPFTGIGFGTKYAKRHRETPQGRVPVSAFVAKELLHSIVDHPEVLLNVSKTDFESLVAELFVGQGYEVDLFRPSKDDGIDFLAIRKDGNTDPIVFAVQTKHPDARPEGERRTTLPVATVREIYGVAKAWNLQGAIAVTSSTYSPAAERFADLRPEEISLADASDVIEWARKYRWNRDE